MTDALTIAKRYFELSNRSDLDEIEALMKDNTTYSSQNTGVFLGAGAIMAMQRRFHASFEALHWDINSVEEIRPGVVLIDFIFKGTTKTGEKVALPGMEYIIVYDGKIQHVDIRNK